MVDTTMAFVNPKVGVDYLVSSKQPRFRIVRKGKPRTRTQRFH